MLHIIEEDDEDDDIVMVVYIDEIDINEYLYWDT